MVQPPRQSRVELSCFNVLSLRYGESHRLGGCSFFTNWRLWIVCHAGVHNHDCRASQRMGTWQCVARAVAEAASQLAVRFHVVQIFVSDGAVASCFVTRTTARADLVGARVYANTTVRRRRRTARPSLPSRRQATSRTIGEGATTYRHASTVGAACV